MSDNKSKLPIILSVVLHLVLIGFVLWKFIWQPNIPEHKYVDAPIQARIAQAPKKSPPQPSADEAKKREQQREQERLKKQQQEKERLEKIEREKKIAEQKAKEQAELERKKKIALEKKLEEEKRKKEEAEKKRLAEEKRKKEEAEKKRLAEEKRKKEEAERKKREEAERKRKEEERKRQEKLERLRKELAAEEGEMFDAMEGDVRKAQIMTARDKFVALIDAKIQRNWYKPKNPGVCEIQIRTGPGGVVLDAQVAEGTDDATCDTGLAAVYRSEPLPYPEDPDVIEELRIINITFEPKKQD